MRYEDQLYSHAAYFKAALAAIDIYTRISDKPELTEEKLCTYIRYPPTAKAIGRGNVQNHLLTCSRGR